MQLDGLPEAERAAAEAAWAEARADALALARRREAAAVLLQRRMPALVLRLKAVRDIRTKAARWAPWAARLNALLGLVAAAESKAYVEAKVKQADAGEAAGADASAPAAPSMASKPSSPKTGSRPTSPSRPVSPGKKDPKAAGAKPGTPKGGRKDAGPAEPETPALPPPITALTHLARSAQLAARGTAWHELLNTTRHAWNTCRALINVDTSLMAPTPKLVWETGPMPPPPTAPESTIAPAAVGKDAKGGKGGAAAKKEDPKAKAGAKDAKGAAAGKKGATTDSGTFPEPVWGPVPIPKNAGPNVGRALRSATEALLTAVAAFKAGAPLHTGVLPQAKESSASEGANGGKVSSSGGGPGTVTCALERPATQASQVTESSHFSFGSDLAVELWFQGGPLDMEWVNKFVVMVLNVLFRMNRFHSVLALGERAWAAEGIQRECSPAHLPPFMQSAGGNKETTIRLILHLTPARAKQMCFFLAHTSCTRTRRPVVAVLVRGCL